MSSIPLSAARRALAAWPLDEARILGATAKLYRIRASQGTFALKPIRHPGRRLGWTGHLQQHLRTRGFDRMGFLVPAASGDIAVRRDGITWTLSQWVPGRELDYGQTSEMAGAAGVLAAFHRAAAGFPRSRLEGPAATGRWSVRIASRCAELLGACREAVRSGRADGPPGWLAAQTPVLEAHARRALFMLNESGYPQWARRARTTAPVCHGDPAAHNFIIQPASGRIYLIDLNSLAADMQCVDLWKLLYRTGASRGWDPAALRRVLRAYCAVRPLDPVETGALLGLLWFPQRQWRLACHGEAGPGQAPPEADLAHKEACLLQLEQEAQELARAALLVPQRLDGV